MSTPLASRLSSEELARQIVERNLPATAAPAVAVRARFGSVWRLLAVLVVILFWCLAVLAHVEGPTPPPPGPAVKTPSDGAYPR